MDYSGLPVHPMWFEDEDEPPEPEDGGPTWYRDDEATLGIQWLSTLEAGKTREAERRTARWVAGWQMRHFPHAPDPRQWDWRLSVARIRWRIRRWLSDFPGSPAS